MTIRFLADYPPYKANDIATLSAGEETSLVSQNFATTNLTGGNAYNPALPDVPSYVLHAKTVSAAKFAQIQAAGVPSNINISYRVTETGVVWKWNILSATFVAEGSGGSSSSANSLRTGKQSGNVFTMPAGQLGNSAASGFNQVVALYTSAGMSITGSVLTVVNPLVAGNSGTTKIKAAVSGKGGTVITGPGIPAGTYVNSYGTGNGTTGAGTGTYNLANAFGTAIPDTASGVVFGAAYNNICYYRAVRDSYSHRALFGNFGLVQGNVNDGTKIDFPSNTPLKITAVWDFVGKDTTNVRAQVKATFNGLPYLLTTANELCSVWCDNVNFPAFAGENFAIKINITHADGVSAFQMPAFNAHNITPPESTANDAYFGKEGIFNSGSDVTSFLVNDAGTWSSGTLLSSDNQYRPIAVVSDQVATLDKKGVVALSDSIIVSDTGWWKAFAQLNQIPYNNLGKAGEAQDNIPFNFTGRGQALIGDILMIELGTNNTQASGFAALQQLWKIGRMAGFKTIIQCTCPPSTVTVPYQISTGSIDFTTGILTVSTKTGSAILVGSPIKGTNVPANTLISSQLSGTAGSTGTYQLQTNGGAYTGVANETTPKIDTWNSLISQSQDTANRVSQNASIRAAVGTGTGVNKGPDYVIDIEKYTASPTDILKWIPGLSADGKHPFTTAGFTAITNGLAADNVAAFFA